MAVHEQTPRRLVDRHGGTEAWWIRYRAELVAAGVLNKKGRKFFGADEDVGAWLKGEKPEGADGDLAGEAA